MANSFQGKRVTVMGLGLYKEGTGIEAVKFFLRHGAKVTVTDLRSARELEGSIRELVKYYNKMSKMKSIFRFPSPGLRPPSPSGRGEGKGVKKLTFILGQHRKDDFRSADIVFQNPSVPADSPYLRVARKAGVPIVNDWSIFLARYTPKLFVGITGTRGKSTVTALIYEMLKKYYSAIRANRRIGKSLSRTTGRLVHGVSGKVWLAGNLGVSPLAFIDIYRGEPIVAELSSWLLHHFADVKKSPNIAVVTNIMNDHMNKYRNMREYIADKENIFRFQKRGDVVVLNADDSTVRKMARKARGRVAWFDMEHGTWNMEQKLLGEHNVANVNAAVAAAEVCGIPRDTIVSVLKTFHGLPGRLELVRTVHGIKYYNDTTATTPEATIAALKTLGARGQGLGTRKIVLICGGADKKLDYREMAKYVKKHCKAVVLLPGSATPKIELRIKNYELRIVKVKDMREAVRHASRIAKASDAVLLSPAAASFGLFKNEFDRGRQFVDAVKKLW